MLTLGRVRVEEESEPGGQIRNRIEDHVGRSPGAVLILRPVFAGAHGDAGHAGLPRTGDIGFQIVADHGDLFPGNAELMRCRRRKTVECVELLLACQHELGCGQRVGHLAGFLGEPPGIERQEDHARQHGGQHADLVERGQLQAGRPVPG